MRGLRFCESVRLMAAVARPFTGAVFGVVASNLIGGAAFAQVLTSSAAPSVRPHAASDVVRFKQSGGAYTLEHPTDWRSHEAPGRVTIGPDDGLVASERGFRTIYGVIATIVDDPLAAGPDGSIESSTRAMVESVLKRNPHQTLKTPVHADGTLAGMAAASAILIGTSPMTGRGERAEIVCGGTDRPRCFT